MSHASLRSAFYLPVYPDQASPPLLLRRLLGLRIAQPERCHSRERGQQSRVLLARPLLRIRYGTRLFPLVFSL